MGNLDSLTSKDFAKDQCKKGYKHIGWTQARICLQKDQFCMTEPFEHTSYNNEVFSGEYIIWDKEEQIAEIKDPDLAHAFLSYVHSLHLFES